LPWALPQSDDERLALAKGYPFEAPGFSYLFADGGHRPLSAGGAPGGLFDGRVPVIAHGSNRAPAQLARKYGNGARIPVSRAWLGDYDVVYSAHVTQYGAIAANLQHAPGARVQVFVTWLDDVQLARMHETELGGENYHYGRMAAVRLDLETGPAEALEAAFVYLSARGCLARDGAPLGLATVPAERRPHGELHQEQAQALVRERHRPCRPLDQMILDNIRDRNLRGALVREMMAEALPAAAPHFNAIDP
jgi:hypothetical protein